MGHSKNQHFLPVFYLNQFTDNDGLFYIFDVKRKKFKQNGKKFHPNSHFYEIHSNTVTKGNTTSDFIEQSYMKHDTEAANIFRKIRGADSGEINLSPREWTYLQYYISILYWRLPCNRQNVHNQISEANTLKQIGLSLKDNVTNIKINDSRAEDLLKQLKDDKNFVKFYKSMIPGHSYPESFDQNDFAHIREFPSGLPKFVSDNPIIYLNPGKVSIHADDLIYPLTPTRLLFRNRMPNILLHTYIRPLTDMLCLVQAKDYVACTDLKYPLQLLDQFEKQYKNIEKLRKELFAFVLPST